MSEEQAPMDFYDGNGKLLFRMDASQPLGVHDLRLPGAIHFNAGNTVEVMRLSRDGVWVNPDLKPDEVAQAVLNALDANIKLLVQRAVEAEREACAKVCDEIDRRWINQADKCAVAIRGRT